MRHEFTNQTLQFLAANPILIYAGAIAIALVVTTIALRVLFPSPYD